ncbi:expressed unknown protein [Seminavis robusta]|uniref:Ubiquitin-like domain-containing protein n=1 Tax=Seminavis robusta TaxID=568900 RepID=A0A9N8HDK2_9STRA|nr:expressed unknown protein [Seminavis robusta]|eukprot:Sro431_g141500.1 n/a (754) ;mRNA; r:48198-50459
MEKGLFSPKGQDPRASSNIVVVILSKLSDYAEHVKVCKDSSVSAIKAQIHGSWGIPPDQQHLTFEGRLLADKEVLESIGIGNESELHLTLTSQKTNSTDDSIIVSIVGLDDSRSVLTVPRTVSVAHLKEKYKSEREKAQFYTEIDLTHMDVLLEDHLTLAEYKIGYQTISTIFAAFRCVKEPSSRSDRTVSAIITGISKSIPLSQNQSSNQAVRIFFEDLSFSTTIVVNVDAPLADLKQIYLKCLRSNETCARIGRWKATSSAEDAKLRISSLQPNSFSLMHNKQVVDERKRVGGLVEYGTPTLSVHLNTMQNKCLQHLMETARRFAAHRNDAPLLNAMKHASSTLTDSSKVAQSRIYHFHQLKSLQTEQTSEDMKKATNYTSEILQKKPSGTLGSDPLIVAHVLAALCRQNQEDILFYDSSKGMHLLESSASINDLLVAGRSMVLRLASLKGLFGVSEAQSETEEFHKMVEMQAALQTGVSHPLLEDIKLRLARCLEVEASRIVVANIFKGSVCVEYTVNDLTLRERHAILQQDTNGRLQREFREYLELKIHPLMFRPAFDLAMFDPLGNKSFVREGQSFQVGPSGFQKMYKQPQGWTRFGLKVRTEDPQGDRWLHPFQDPGNWWRAFHGTSNAGRYMAGVDRQDPTQMADAAMDAAAHIYTGGFHTAHQAAYGPGVYCSPDPAWLARSRHVAIVGLNIQGHSQPKQFKCMLQVAVLPGSDTLETRNVYSDYIWCVKQPDHIRPYGILVKEA